MCARALCWTWKVRSNRLESPAGAPNPTARPVLPVTKQLYQEHHQTTTTNQNGSPNPPKYGRITPNHSAQQLNTSSNTNLMAPLASQGLSSVWPRERDVFSEIKVCNRLFVLQLTSASIRPISVQVSHPTTLEPRSTNQQTPTAQQTSHFQLFQLHHLLLHI